jgi:oxygen-independent coproporphyrinogen-3 oxidase
VLTEGEQLRDAVIFGLRLIQGIPTEQLRAHASNYGHTATLEALREQQLIEEEGERSRLSAQGRLHADTVADKLY